MIGRGPEKAKCERLAADLNLGDRVTFIEWIKDHSQVATTLQQFRAFVFPSLAEANGIVVQEAMLLGVPVIALDWGGPALLVTPQTGILIKPTDEDTVVNELAAAMDRLATDGDLAERFSVAGRDRAVAEGYRWQDLIERWIDVYRRVAGSPVSVTCQARIRASVARATSPYHPRPDVIDRPKVRRVQRGRRRAHPPGRRPGRGRQAAGHQVVVVVSAMGDTTDDLIDLATQVCTVDGVQTHPPKREMDQLLATGEQVTIALMAMALCAQGHEAISFTGGQIGLVTDTAFSKARIQSINKRRIFDQLDAGKIVIVAGFQGITPDGDLTTLGRGGSNATLVAVGAVLGADVCENYTDVDGIYTADPRLVPNARKIDRISYDEMLELSGLGASVLQTRAVEFAKKYDVRIHVRNSQNTTPAR